MFEDQGLAEPPAGVVSFPVRAGVALPEKERDVDKINPYKFYELGTELHGLTTQRQEESTVWQVFTHILAGRKWLEELLTDSLIPLSVSRRAAQELKRRIDTIYRDYCCDENGKFSTDGWDSKKISYWDWNSLASEASRFEHILEEELREATTYFVPKSSIFNTVDLMERAETAIPAPLLEYVNKTAKGDFHAAGRCLAVGLNTACGFHSVRAVEGVLGDYYETFAGKSPKEDMTMFDYTDGLRKKREAKGASPLPDEKTLTTLDQIRVHERNPVAHPRVVLDEVDALNVFHKATSAILEMAKEMVSVKAQTGLPTLALVASNKDAG